MDALQPNNYYLLLLLLFIYLFIYLFIPELNLEKIVQFFRNPFPAIGHRDPEKYIPLAANVECKHILNKAEP